MRRSRFPTALMFFKQAASCWKAKGEDLLKSDLVRQAYLGM